MGKFTFRDVLELQNEMKNVTIIVDKNLVSPICEIAKNGFLKEELRLRKVAMFVTWAKYLNARLTCGMGILETDTSEICTISGEEERLQFLHGVDQIPVSIWKEIAFGYRDSVPNMFLYRQTVVESKNYKLNDNFLLLSNEVAIIKIVQLVRVPNMSAIDKFINFMEWYTDNLAIAESIMTYAACVYANIPNVSLHKNARSKEYQKVVKGIKNQAWDITYIVAWSIQFRNEEDGNYCMFATDDITQKIIVVNIIPQGQCADTLHAIFSTNSQYKKLMQLSDSKLGNARVHPFEKMEMEEKVCKVKELVNKEYSILQEMCQG